MDNRRPMIHLDDPTACTTAWTADFKVAVYARCWRSRRRTWRPSGPSAA
jgi:hypothetical protein